MSSRKGFISLIVGTITLLVIAVAVGGYVTWQSQIPQDSEKNSSPYAYRKKRGPSPTPPSQGVVCAQDAKQCPDGSYVSRQGPTCRFAVCPGEKPAPQSAIPADWKTYRNEKYGFEMRYPKEWNVWPFGFDADVRIASSLYEDRAHGSGKPSGIWIDITDYVSGSDNRCFDTDGEFVHKRDGGGLIRVICQRNLAIQLNYDDRFAEEKANEYHEFVLNQTLLTFKFIK